LKIAICVAVPVIFLLGFFIFPTQVKDQGKAVGISVKPTPGPEPQLLRGPYLQVATSQSIVVRWRTDAAERGVVRYGTSPHELTTVINGEQITMEHIVKLNGLKPSTKYYYTIGGLTHTLEGDSNNYFITLPQPGTIGKYRIAALGDCGNNSANQKSVRDQIVKYLGANYMNGWILLGDNAYESGTDAEYQKNFFDIFQDAFLKKYPLFPTPGNHDYRDIDSYRGKSKYGQQVAYFQNFSMPVHGEAGGVPSGNQAYYSYDIGNIHFLSLDSYGIEDSAFRLYDTTSRQVQWVKKDLELNKEKDNWVVAYWHHPPYSMGSHNSDKEKELIKIRENFIRILERYGVDLVLCGHSHSYERSNFMNGHYGPENSYSSAYNVSKQHTQVSGKMETCTYTKQMPHGMGTVYVVSGSAGKIDSRTQPSFPHNAMVYSNAKEGGGLMLEVEGDRLDLKWVCADGVVRDAFTMIKNEGRPTVIKLKRGQSATLTALFSGKYTWLSKQTTKSITVAPPVGEHNYTVSDEDNCVTQVFKVLVTEEK
jgi:hypothetical protein